MATHRAQGWCPGSVLPFLTPSLPLDPAPSKHQPGEVQDMRDIPQVPTLAAQGEPAHSASGQICPVLVSLVSLVSLMLANDCSEPSLAPHCAHHQPRRYLLTPSFSLLHLLTLPKTSWGGGVCDGFPWIKRSQRSPWALPCSPECTISCEAPQG